MPIIKSAIKRAKQTLKRRERNIGIKRDIKSAVKAFMAEPSGLSSSPDLFITMRRETNSLR